jgi:hypothetical protein
MRRLAILATLLVSPAIAEEPDTLRLACRADQPAMSGNLAFSIDFTAKAATETTSGKRLGVIAGHDSIALFDPAQGPNAVVWRIDRVTGRFSRVDTQLRLEGTCDKVERRF